MFGFGRKTAIRHRAKELRDTLPVLVQRVGSQTFDDFVEAMGRARDEFQENYVDRGDRIGFGDKVYGFSEVGPHQGEFSFHAVYPKRGRPHISVEGHGPYFGLVITGSRVDEGIYVDFRALKKMGRDAHRMQNELLRFPGFTSMEQIKKRLGL